MEMNDSLVATQPNPSGDYPVASAPTELDNELLERSKQQKQKHLTDMVKYRAIYITDKTNDYPYFLYLASIMNFVESHNGGCMSEWGMKSLELDVSPYVRQMKEEGSLGQKDYVRFLLNILNAYAITVLSKGLIEFSIEAPDTFFTLNDFPTSIREDFEGLKEKATELIPKLQKILDTYTPLLENKYKKIFNEEKTKGFLKPIFDATAIKQSGRFPTDLANARECK